MEYTAIAPDKFALQEGLDDWTVVGTEIHASYSTRTYLSGAELIVTVARIADEKQHHPDMELRYPGCVHVMLTTHAVGGLTTLDADLARLISDAAAAAGATAETNEI